MNTKKRWIYVACNELIVSHVCHVLPSVHRQLVLLMVLPGYPMCNGYDMVAWCTHAALPTMCPIVTKRKQKVNMSSNAISCKNCINYFITNDIHLSKTKYFYHRLNTCHQEYVNNFYTNVQTFKEMKKKPNSWNLNKNEKIKSSINNTGSGY